MNTSELSRQIRNIELTTTDAELPELGNKIKELKANISKVLEAGAFRRALEHMCSTRFGTFDPNIVAKVEWFVGEDGMLDVMRNVDLDGLKNCTSVEQVTGLKGLDGLIELWSSFDGRMNRLWKPVLSGLEGEEREMGDYILGCMAEAVRSVLQTQLWIISAQCMILRKLDM